MKLTIDILPPLRGATPGCCMKHETRLKIPNTQFLENVPLTYEADRIYFDSTSLSNSRLLYDRSRRSYLR